MEHKTLGMLYSSVMGIYVSQKFYSILFILSWIPAGIYMEKPGNVRFKCVCVLNNTLSLQGNALLLWGDHYCRLFILYFQNQYRLYMNGKSDSVSNKKQKRNHHP